ncbi:HK97 family phage prohead protease [Blastopirellula marina]|uniref:HK97 family phage prohead protease n=1 Tax=Blastopirellula marina TaxID=124 RepID=A0A2S8F7F9_9BACT|nr:MULTISPECIES: HK97 family phage prohead protease [Pirellulaceae]PQO28092.1 HK97 family phage prohead protease [Blastopirellula marina]RCS48518.1 HK97 family phage prohead protease [Bremerella cremea]
MNNIEHFFSTTELTTEAKDNSPGTISGYFHKWNTLSHDRGGYRVVFRKGSFSNITDGDIKAYRDHDYNIYLGRTANTTLRLSEDDVGTPFSLDLPDTTHGRDTAALIEREDIVGMSFGYVPDKYRWKRETQGPVQEHFSGTLVEVSLVFSPAFPNTNVQKNHLYSLNEPNPEFLESLQEFLGTPNRNFAFRTLQLMKISQHNTK